MELYHGIPHGSLLVSSCAMASHVESKKGSCYARVMLGVMRLLWYVWGSFLFFNGERGKGDGDEL